MTLADAITQLENTNPSYNNPGAISGTGDTGTSFGAGIGIFSTPNAGQQALQNQLSLVYGGADKLYPGGTNMTLDQFGEVYAPNQNYGSSLASILGVPSTTPLSAITPYGNSEIDPNIRDIMLGAADAAANAPDIKGSTLNSYWKTALLKLGIPVSGTLGLEDYVIIIVGIVIIAAGLFAFKSTQTVIQTGGRAVRRGIEAASA